MAQTNYTPIQLYYSSTASAVPVNTNLASGELAINITDGKLFYKDNAGAVQTLATKAATSGTFATTTISTSETLSYGTANGVAYLNGSKVLTTGSALTFDGTTFTAGTATGQNGVFKTVIGSGGANEGVVIVSGTTGTGWLGFNNGNNANIPGQVTYNHSTGALSLYANGGPVIFSASAAEGMRLTSTGLGIGTSSPQSRLEVRQDQSGAITRVIANNNFANTGAGSSFDYYYGTSRLGGLTHAFAASGAYLSFDVWSGSAATQRMLLDGSGNLGIGTSSPAYKLDVNGTARFNNTFDFGGGQSITSGSGSYRAAKFGAASGAYNVLFSGSTALSINDNADTINLLVLTNGGNLGLGVTPSAWDSGWSAIQVSTQGASFVGRTGGNEAISLSNAYRNSASWKYITSTSASMYQCGNGIHTWFIAPSGTAGNAITFIQAMTLDASGNLGIGTTSPLAKLNVSGGTTIASLAEWNSKANTVFTLANAAVRLGVGYDANDQPLIQGFDSTNGARPIGLQVYGGNVGIGTSSPSSKLNVYGNYIRVEDGTYAGFFGKGSTVVASGGTADLGISTTTGNILFGTGASIIERMRIDTSGNLGLGVTPSAWGSGHKAIQIGSASVTNSSGDFLNLVGNAYYNGTNWIAQLGDTCALYQVNNGGAFVWSQAPVTTAGATATFTERMRLDSSGKLLLGVTSGTGLSNGDFAMGNGNHIRFRNAANSAYISAFEFTSANGLNIGTGGSLSTITFGISGIGEAGRFDTSGNLLVGTTSDVTNGGMKIFPNYDATGSTSFEVGHITGSSSGNRYAGFKYAGTLIGTITQNGTTGVLYNLTSDYRLKNDQQALTGAKDFIMALKPKRWQWWDGSGEGVGFVAHEFMEVAKHSGNGEKDAVDAEGKPVYQSIQPSSSEVMANLVAFIQEQQAIIQSLTARITALEGA